MHSQTLAPHKIICTHGHECSFTEQPGTERCKTCAMFRFDAKKTQPVFDLDYGLEVGRANRVISEFSRQL